MRKEKAKRGIVGIKGVETLHEGRQECSRLQEAGLNSRRRETERPSWREGEDVKRRRRMAKSVGYRQERHEMFKFDTKPAPSGR